MRRGFLGGGAGLADPTGRLASLRAKLADAEHELQHRRQERLNLAAAALPRGAAPEAQSARPAHIAHTVSDAAIEALISHAKPPPVLHRLASALVLVMEAKTFADLGVEELPGKTPWKNLQSLFLRPDDL